MPREGTADVRSNLRELLALASLLATHWDELDEIARQRTAAELKRIVDELARSTPSVEAKGATRSRTSGAVPRLTPRELEVLAALSSGRSTEEIARSLGITTATVRSHVKNIFTKLGAHSRVEAVLLALARPTGD
jgi:DNA-binding CsgD family transcriptional regulator